MASGYVGKGHWDYDDRSYSSGSHSDDSPILSHRRRYMAYTTPAFEERERRSSFSALGKFCLFCAAMIFFCVIMYLPVYNKANYHMTRKGEEILTVTVDKKKEDFPVTRRSFVSGWTINTNRDTKIYVQPNNVTTVYEPKHICRTKDKTKKLPLLIIVCSATSNFERRTAIRETWGNYANYKQNLLMFTKIRDKYKSYDFKYDLYPQRIDLKPLDVGNITNENFTFGDVNDRHKRDISSLNQLLPVLAKAISNISLSSYSGKTEKVPEEKRFEDDDDSIVPGFDMNKELDLTDRTDNIDDFDYNYDSNIMKIPPKGYEDESPDLNSVLSLLKQSKDFDRIKHNVEEENPEFRLVFLLGMPNKDNGSVQRRIESEIDQFDDIIQEGFIDSYNNLTLKSIMMLKWVTKNCIDSVRYILKTDDDTYVNVPNLMLNLNNISQIFDNKTKGKVKEYLLIGDVITGAKPVLEPESKWYSPRYMYGGRVYPRYLSGMGYAMSAPTALALYNAALITHYFHLEDIYITGMCAHRATPRIYARDDGLFSYSNARSEPCRAHAQATAHRVTPNDMRAFYNKLTNEEDADRCERIRLTKVRQDEIRRKLKLKKAAAAKLAKKQKF